MPIVTIINLGQMVFLSVEEVDHLNRSWVQFQSMEHFSLHRDGPDKSDKDYGAVPTAAVAVLVGWTVGKWLRRRNDEAIAERRRQAEFARGRIGSTRRCSLAMSWSACTAIIRQRCNAAVGFLCTRLTE